MQYYRNSVYLISRVLIRISNPNFLLRIKNLKFLLIKSNSFNRGKKICIQLFIFVK